MLWCARRYAALLVLSVCWVDGGCRAQEIEPRAYSPSPSGVNFLVLVAGHSEGGVLTDPSLPVTDIEAKIGALGFGFGRTFGMFGHSANVGFALPYLTLDASGNIGEDRASVRGVGGERAAQLGRPLSSAAAREAKIAWQRGAAVVAHRGELSGARANERVERQRSRVRQTVTALRTSSRRSKHCGTCQSATSSSSTPSTYGWSCEDR